MFRFRNADEGRCLPVSNVDAVVFFNCSEHPSQQLLRLNMAQNSFSRLTTLGIAGVIVPVGGSVDSVLFKNQGNGRFLRSKPSSISDAKGGVRGRRRPCLHWPARRTV